MPSFLIISIRSPFDSLLAARPSYFTLHVPIVMINCAWFRLWSIVFLASSAFIFFHVSVLWCISSCSIACKARILTFGKKLRAAAAKSISSCRDGG